MKVVEIRLQGADREDMRAWAERRLGAKNWSMAGNDEVAAIAH